MAENKNIEIGGRLHSIATGNIVTGANEIFDDDKGKKQSQINTETDAALEDRYTKAETYNKTQLDNMITTPNQQYESVTATAQTTSATDVLPATGAANTIYRVGNWDGSQFDASVYSEYAWNGSSYVHLNTKTQVGEVFDISAYHATGGELATYADLAAALDSNNGGGVPQSLQKGGMSIKFIQGNAQSSDNKYVQYRLMSNVWSTTVTDWQGVDDKISELEGKTEEISKEIIETDEDFISIEDNNGNEVFHLDENGLDAKNVKSNGKEVLTEHQDISRLATKKEVADKQDKIPQVSQEETIDDADEQIFASDNYDTENGTGEAYVSIGHYGIKAKAVYNRNNVNIAEETFNLVDMNKTPSGEYLWNDIYVGCNVPAEEDSFIDEIEISQYNTDKDFYKTAEFLVGTIDQRNWLLVRKKYIGTFKESKNGIITFVFKNALLKKGEVVVYKALANGGNKTVSWSADVTGAEVFCTMSFRDYYKPNRGIARFVIRCAKPKRGYAIDDKIEYLHSKIQSINKQLSKAGILTDTVTNKHYRIKVANGVLGLKDVDYNNILVFSNSWCTHAQNTEIGWYGWTNTGMAASVEHNDFKNFIKEALGATMQWKGASDIETMTDDLTFDYLDSHWGSINFSIVDAIVICLGLNVSADSKSGMKDRWSVMVEYLKTKCPNADIYLSAQNSIDIEKIAIVQSVCERYDCFYVDLHTEWKIEYNQILGNYTYGNDSQYHEIVNRGVCGHPSDIGMMYTANAFLSAMGHDEYLSKVFDINLVQSAGGDISVVSNQWVANGIVSVKCSPKDGKSVGNIVVTTKDGASVGSTLKTNDYGIYCVFAMPYSDVTVTASWV